MAHRVDLSRVLKADHIFALACSPAISYKIEDNIILADPLILQKIDNNPLQMPHTGRTGVLS
jgi:hypothetical protein